MKRNLVVGATLALTLVWLLVAVAPAAADRPEIDNHWLEYTRALRACSGEWVQLSMQSHYLYIFHVDDPDYHFVQAIARKGTGFGVDSGTRYQLVQVSTSTANGQMDSQTGEHNFEYRMRFIGQGPDNDALLYTKEHLTVNANGVWTVDIFEQGFECK